MSIFSSMRDAVLFGGMSLVGKIIAKVMLAFGGTFVVSEYVLTPVYNAIMAALISAGSGGDLYQWLELARIPDIITVAFAGMGVTAAQRIVFRKLTGSP